MDSEMCTVLSQGSCRRRGGVHERFHSHLHNAPHPAVKFPFPGSSNTVSTCSTEGSHCCTPDRALFGD